MSQWSPHNLHSNKKSKPESVYVKQYQLILELDMLTGEVLVLVL